MYLLSGLKIFNISLIAKNSKKLKIVEIFDFLQKSQILNQIFF